MKLTGSEIRHRDWICAYDLACPKLKYNKPFWIALNEDPCVSGDCNVTRCPNYKRSFPGRLIIIKVPKEIEL